VRGVALAARWILAALLATAGIAKATSRAKSELMLPGIPRAWQPVLVVAIPVVEVVTAVTLVASPYDAAPAWFAAFLLLAFTAVLLRNQGAPCNCFGSLSRAPITGRTIVRNAIFIALAILATGTRGSS
jgi:hypothetical protein